jgi:hypothetical protein
MVRDFQNCCPLALLLLQVEGAANYPCSDQQRNTGMRGVDNRRRGGNGQLVRQGGAERNQMHAGGGGGDGGEGHGCICLEDKSCV